MKVNKISGVLTGLGVISMQASVAHASVSPQSMLASGAAYIQKTQMSTMKNWGIVASFAGNEILSKEAFTKSELNPPKTTDLETLILAVLAAHQDPHNVDGVNLVKLLDARQITSGSNAGYVADDTSHTVSGSIASQAYAILASIAAGKSSLNITEIGKWLVKQQNSDGGFSYQAGVTASDSNDTAYVLLALHETGYSNTSAPVQKAIAYLRTCQMDDGGFGDSATASGSDSDSTGVTVDALWGLGINPLTWTKDGKTESDSFSSLYDAKTGGFKFDNSGSEWSGVNGFSTRDALFGLQANLTHRSIYERLQPVNLTSLNSYWTEIRRAGGMWENHRFMSFAEVENMAVAGTHFSQLNPYWQSIAKRGGMWESVSGMAVWHPWNNALAGQALIATFGADSLDVSVWS